ncbi:17522_t:CDS:2, partial [Dentiscutata erythropus]
PDWAEEYKPKTYIFANIYNHLTEPITLRELNETLTESPLKKAPGLTGITNKMLKHLGPTGDSTFLHILNACLSLQTIPTTWLQANQYFTQI